MLTGKPWLLATCAALCLLLSLHSAVADEQPFRMLSPSGGNSHPAVLLVPGCSGFAANNGADHYNSRAAELQAAGYAVVFVDYVERRMQTNCAHVLLPEVAHDIVDAANWARQQPGIDASRVSVIGWSYGGGGVLAALKSMPLSTPIDRAVMFYPVCRGAGPWSAPVTALMLLGAKDDVAYPSLCKPVIDGVTGDRLRVITYPEARHGFDIEGSPVSADQHPGAPVYNAAAANASWAAVTDFLK